MSKARPRHKESTLFDSADNGLLVNGKSLIDLKELVGQTPYYAYDSNLISERVGQLRQELPSGISLHYAMKANPMPEVVSHLAALTDGLDVASHGELEVALATGTTPAEISFAGPGKSSEDLRAAVAAGVIINLESAGEMERIAHTGAELGTQPRVSVRVNPDFELKTSGMKMGGGPKPFGVDAEQVPALLGRLAELSLDFRGFHIFSGSQNLKVDAIIEAQANTFELAYRLADHAPGPVRWLNIGGGFGVPYFPGENRLDLRPVSEQLGRPDPETWKSASSSGAGCCLTSWSRRRSRSR